MQSLRMALKSIMTNKVRSALTMLGIIIGVGAVIVMVSMVQGSTKQITDKLTSMGTNLISVSVNGRGGSRAISEDDMFKLVEDNPTEIEAVSPQISGQVTVKNGTTNVKTTLVGTNEVYETVKNTKVQEGRFINALDVERRQKIAIIGTYISNELFGTESAVNQEIKVNGDIYTVVGVLEVKSNSTAQSSDDTIIIPYTTAKRLLKNAKISTFYVQAKTTETIDAAMALLEASMFKTFNSTDAYRVFNQADMLESVNSTTKTLTMMMGGIAGISLLVGGIGIMNIMLVTVTERTREIGVRKALGAKRRNILQQFLIEAIVVSCLGGILGIGIGIGLTNIVSKFMSMTASISTLTVMISFSFSVFIGVVFGVYPANKASKLNPIQALRVE